MSTFSAFDVGTLLFTVAITALVATGLLLMSALRHRREVKGLPYWTVSGLLLSIAGPLFMLQHDGLTFFSVFLPNTFSLVGLFLIGAGLRRLHRRSLGRADWGVIIMVVALSGVFLSFTLSGWPGIEGRIIAVAAGITVTTGYIMWSLPPSFAGSLVGASITGAAVVLMGSSLMQVVNILFISDTEATGLVQLDSLHVVFVVTQMAATITLLFALVLVVPHQLAMQKEVLTERIRKASEAKSRFLTGVAHDLRGPLSLISAFGEILAERLKGEEQKFVHDIRLAADELNAMAGSLTELAQLQEGAIELERHPTPVGALIRDVADAERFAAAKAGIDLRTVTPGSAADADLPADPALKAMTNEQSLRRIVKNLVKNALSYSRQGDTVTLEVYASRASVAQRAHGSGINQTIRSKRGPNRRAGKDTDADPVKARAVVITISDTGPGIEPEFMDDLFEPFARNAPGTEGTGLGLAITKELVEAMSGTISVQSKLGEGTYFEIRLPCANPT